MNDGFPGSWSPDGKTLAFVRKSDIWVLVLERDHGALGFVARASGIDQDVRRDHPFAAYDELNFQVPCWNPETSGPAP
jgi:NADH:ubiquinone oxidoreductase subunit D